jgi:hypothetical protein
MSNSYFEMIFDFNYSFKESFEFLIEIALY